MRRTWTDDEILYAILEWNEEHGEPPRFNDWVRTGGNVHPTSATVVRVFGSWNKGIAAAGLEIRPSNGEGRPFSREEASALREDGLSDRAIGEKLGVTGDRISRALGPRPKPTRALRNRTREERIADLQAALAKENNDKALAR